MFCKCSSKKDTSRIIFKFCFLYRRKLILFSVWTRVLLILAIHKSEVKSFTSPLL